LGRRLKHGERHFLAEVKGTDVNSILDRINRIDGSLANLRTWAETGEPLPFIDEGLDFVVGPPMEEAHLKDIEAKYEIVFPSEYRAFLASFGDTSIGPGNLFRTVNDGLTIQSKNPFPLTKPFLGALSPTHRRLLSASQLDEYGHLLEEWERIPKDDGV